MDRRSFLYAGSAVALSLPLLSGNAAKALAAPSGKTAAAGDAALNALFDRIFNEQVRTAPTFATSLGLDKGKLAYLKSKLDTRPYRTARAQELARNRRFLAELKAVSPARLSNTISSSSSPTRAAPGPAP